MEEIKKIIDEMSITPGNKFYCQSLQCQTYHDDKIKRTYIYKLPGFNEAFQALQKLLPEFTEEEFAYIGTWGDCYNDQLVAETDTEIPYYELLKVVEFVAMNKENIKYHDITLNIIGVDIEPNMLFVVNIMKLCEPFIIQ